MSPRATPAFSPTHIERGTRHTDSRSRYLTNTEHRTVCGSRGNAPKRRSPGHSAILTLDRDTAVLGRHRSASGRIEPGACPDRMPVLAARTANTMRQGRDEPIEALILGTGWPNIYRAGSLTS